MTSFSANTVGGKVRWDVHKFGGTSVGSAQSMKKCIEIIRPLCSNNRVAVVVSAMGGKPKVTDLLLDSVAAAARNDFDTVNQFLENIRTKHELCIAEMIPDNSNGMVEEIMGTINKDITDITQLLHAVRLMKYPHEQILELVSGYGEQWSANIIAEAMRQEGLPFIYLNARDVLIVEENDIGSTKVHFKKSTEKLNEFIKQAENNFLISNDGKKFASRGDDNDIKMPHLLITGYIASTPEEIATTLKRDGSDFSASIFGNMLDSSAVTIWTDVSGVYSADPRRVPDARIIPYVSYNEAIELAYFGAKVIHPKTMSPAIAKNIPIYIRNTFSPKEAGTKIWNSVTADSNQDKCGLDCDELKHKAVCGFTTIDGIAMINIEGTGLIGVPGIAHRLFGALKGADVSVMFIAQASSEYSICFAVKEQEAELSVQAIQESFFYELKQKIINKVLVVKDCSILAAVGEGMSTTPGTAGLFFTALGEAKINCHSMAQGCDQENLSCVISTNDCTKALRAVHSAFWLSDMEVCLGVIGTGDIGSAVIQSVLEQMDLLERRFQIKINFRGVINTRKMILGENLSETLKMKLSIFDKNNSPRASFDHTEQQQSKRTSSSENRGTENRGTSMRKSHSNMSLDSLLATLQEDDNGQEPSDLKKFSEHMKNGQSSNFIIIDASDSYSVACMHPDWLANGAHLVTANKRAIASSLNLYNEVHDAAKAGKRLYMSEVTIGASLPIKTTLADLLFSGDAIKLISGMMTISCNLVLKNMCEGGMSFSDSISDVYKQRLFEKDPFQDLSGHDGAQKCLVLAREMGVPLEMDDISIEPLCAPRIVRNWTNLGDTFAEDDKIMAAKVAAAAAKGCTLRYIQKVECANPIFLGADMSEESGECSGVVAKVVLEEVRLDTTFGMAKKKDYVFCFHTERYAVTPLILQGPLSDSLNTASGIVGDILRIAKGMGARDIGPDVLAEKKRSRTNSNFTAISSTATATAISTSNLTNPE